MMSDEALLAFRRYVVAYTEMNYTPGTVKDTDVRIYYDGQVFQMNEQANKLRRNTLDNLSDALGRSDDQTIEEVKEDLGNMGIDVNSSLERLMKKREQISSEAKEVFK